MAHPNVTFLFQDFVPEAVQLLLILGLLCWLAQRCVSLCLHVFISLESISQQLLHFQTFLLLTNNLCILSQTIITELNHAIGASGVASQECKALVAQYGQTIIEMLLAKVYVNFMTYLSRCKYVVSRTTNKILKLDN